MGNRGALGLVDVGRHSYWFATSNAREGEAEQAGERRAEMIRRFASWHAPIGSVLEATPDDAILRNDVYYLDPLPRCSRERIVLLGDAAHASTPGIGQGAAQALEDAVALAAALGAAAGIDDVSELADQSGTPLRPTPRTSTRWLCVAIATAAAPSRISTHGASR